MATFIVPDPDPDQCRTPNCIRTAEQWFQLRLGSKVQALLQIAAQHVQIDVNRYACTVAAIDMANLQRSCR
jgi:predicted HicB family RNase H-like nuclease